MKDRIVVLRLISDAACVTQSRQRVTEVQTLQLGHLWHPRSLRHLLKHAALSPAAAVSPATSVSGPTPEDGTSNRGGWHLQLLQPAQEAVSLRTAARADQTGAGGAGGASTEAELICALAGLFEQFFVIQNLW